MYRVLFIIFLGYVLGEEEHRIVILDQGGLSGVKYWNGDFYEFYGVPYASVPKGRDRFQGPLPVKPWKGILEAKRNNIYCYQSYYTEEEVDELILAGEEECLMMNLLVPEVATEKNLVPVVVYIHSGAFAGGNGNMAKYHYLARHDVIVISFNFRVGAFGFACLGNKEIPGNAALKDQVAALRWIHKNIAKFGGDPRKITLAGFSVGAAMAELLTLSKSTEGIIDKLILDSGSALSPFAINRDPISTARNIAKSIGYNDTGKLEDLTEFYLNASDISLSLKSINFFLPNSTFGFAPCIENIHEGIEPVLTESPIDIINKGENQKVPVLIGFANMEGISRLIKFDTWSEMMNKKFSDFLPADLKIDDGKSLDALIGEVKKYYFNGEEVTYDNIQSYVDYFSDSMFKYGIMKSAKLHAEKSNRPVFLYEFSYIGNLNMKYHYMNRIKGASHRDQTAYTLDFFSWTNSYKDLDTRDRLTMMWTDFVKYEDPTVYESSLVNVKWLPFTNNNPNYLQIAKKLQMKKDLFVDSYNFWNKIYDKYYWNASPPTLKM